MKKSGIVYFGALLVIFALMTWTGCATKKFVQGEVATLDKKVEGVQTSVEENQKRIKEHDEKLATLGSLITQQQADLKQTDAKIEDVKKLAQGTLVAKAVLTNEDTKFKFDSSELTPEGKAAVDKFVQTLITENRGVYLEIQGHTDNTGPADYNLILGQKRADAVKDYLYKQYHIPLYRMQVISYGSTAPVGDNATSEGRAQNRRVEVLVYE